MRCDNNIIKRFLRPGSNPVISYDSDFSVIAFNLLINNDFCN